MGGRALPDHAFPGFCTSHRALLEPRPAPTSNSNCVDPAAAPPAPIPSPIGPRLLPEQSPPPGAGTSRAAMRSAGVSPAASSQGLTIHTSAPLLIVAGDGDPYGLPALAQQLWRAARPGGGSGVKRSASTASLTGRRQAARAGRSLLLLALLTVGLLSFYELHVRGGLELAILRAHMGMGRAPPPPPHGLDYPVQSCCIGQQCVRNSKGRHAVVTHVRSQREVAQLQVRTWRLLCGVLVASLMPRPAKTRPCCHLPCVPSLLYFESPVLPELPCSPPLICCSNCKSACGTPTRALTWRSCWWVLPAAFRCALQASNHAGQQRKGPGVRLRCNCADASSCKCAMTLPPVAPGPQHPSATSLQVRGELSASATQRVMSMNVTIFYVEPPLEMVGENSRWDICVAALERAACLRSWAKAGQLACSCNTVQLLRCCWCLALHCKHTSVVALLLICFCRTGHCG